MTVSNANNNAMPSNRSPRATLSTTQQQDMKENKKQQDELISVNAGINASVNLDDDNSSSSFSELKTPPNNNNAAGQYITPT